MVRIQLSAEMIVFTSIARSASRWAARKSLDSSASLLLWLVPHPPCFNERTSDLRLAYALVTSQIENKPYCAVFFCVSLWPRDIRSIYSLLHRAHNFDEQMSANLVHGTQRCSHLHCHWFTLGIVSSNGTHGEYMRVRTSATWQESTCSYPAFYLSLNACANVFQATN